MDCTKELRTISLCHGYGGIEMGLEMAGKRIRHIIISEIEAYPIQVICEKMETGRMVPAPVWTDLRTFPDEDFGEVDLLTGGFPCQSFSSAGKRLADEDPRHLFPHFKRIISQQRPRTVFLENVEGIISAKLKGDGWADPRGTPVLLHVLRELERLGYRATAGVFSASEVGAPHQRKRVYILAHSCVQRLEGGEQCRDNQKETIGREAGSHGGFRQLLTRISKWPVRPGEPQYEWEEPRTIEGKLNPDWVEQLMGLPVGWTGTGNRVDRLRLLGNGVVPQTAAKAFLTLSERLI